MSNAKSSPTPSPQATTNQTIIGVTCTIDPAYPATVTLGQGGYPATETGPKAVPAGCAFGLPTLVFGAAWQH
jgi:hypothetical protein